MLEIILAATIAKGDFIVDVQNTRLGRGKAEAIFKVTNNTAKSYQRVFVKCVFFDADGKAVQIGPAIVSNLRAGDTGFGDAAIIVGVNEKPKSVACDVDQVTE